MIKTTALYVMTLIILTTANSSCKNASSTAREPYTRDSVSQMHQQANLQGQKLQEQKLEQLRIEQQQLAEHKAEQLRIEQQLQTYRMNMTSLLQEARDFVQTQKGYMEPAKFFRTLDLSQCPSDFAVAVMDNIHAWERAAKIESALNDLYDDENVKATIIAEGLSQLLDIDARPLKDAEDAETRLLEAKKQARSDINSTFETVERVAIKYGASLPK